MKPGRTLTFDIESHERNKMYTMKPEEFVRLIGYAWDDGEVVLTTDLEELKQAMLLARFIVGHNIHDFDLRAVWGLDSNVPMRLADEGKVYDTWTHAILVHPAPSTYTNRHGKPARAREPEEMKAWFGLDEQAHQLGVPGKTHSLDELALEFADQSIPKKDKARQKDGYGKIPIDDERYRDYLVGDVNASRHVARELLKLGPLDAYAKREQRIASRLAAMQSAGWRVDVEKATARRDELLDRKADTMAWLVEKYDFPTEGKQPWRSKVGKSAIMKALADAGITPQSRPNWLATKTGYTLGGEVLKELTEGTEAEELGTRLAQLMGARTLAQLTLDSVYPDGRVHPEITALQRSGRTSTTKPGLTVWTSRGPGAIEKDYYIADSDDEALLEIDLSNADARVVAWYSGDKKYAERFEPGADGHLINAWAAWGKDVVGTDKHDPVTADYRYRAKKLGHGWNYGGQAKTLSLQSGVPLEDAKVFVKGMNKTYNRIIAWQEAVRAFARQHGYVINKWGRKMFVEKGREFTQAPALLGQSGTREIMMDALLAMPHNVVRKVKALVHDAFVFSVPKARFEACKNYLQKLMEVTLDAPPGGMKMEFPAEAGPMGDTWYACSHD
jgi:DNA polymerase-1